MWARPLSLEDWSRRTLCFEVTNKFKDLSPPQRLVALGLAAVSLGVVTAAERDLQRRPAGQVRGDKWLWRLVCLNALGALAYFRWGRRQTAPSSL